MNRDLIAETINEELPGDIIGQRQTKRKVEDTVGDYVGKDYEKPSPKNVNVKLYKIYSYYL